MPRRLISEPEFSVLTDEEEYPWLENKYGSFIYLLSTFPVPGPLFLSGEPFQGPNTSLERCLVRTEWNTRFRILLKTLLANCDKLNGLFSAQELSLPIESIWVSLNQGSLSFMFETQICLPQFTFFFFGLDFFQFIVVMTTKPIAHFPNGLQHCVSWFISFCGLI